MKRVYISGPITGWAESLSDAQRYKALGNAVTVNVAEWIAKRLIKEM